MCFLRVTDRVQERVARSPNDSAGLQACALHEGAVVWHSACPDTLLYPTHSRPARGGARDDG